MKKYLVGLISLTLPAFTSCQPAKNSGKETLGKYVPVIHGGDGGVIAVDRTGHFTMTFNTPGMVSGLTLFPKASTG